MDSGAENKTLAVFQQKLHEEIVKGDGESKYANNLGVLPALIGSDLWLFPTAEVSKVSLVERITKVPGAEPHILGISANGGAIYTIVDAGLSMGTSAIQRTQKSRLLLMNPLRAPSGQVQMLAVLVERVLPIRSALSFIQLKDTHNLPVHAYVRLEDTEESAYSPNGIYLANVGSLLKTVDLK